MVSTKTKIRYAFDQVKTAIFLKILAILTFFSPRCGNWFKRVFFIITLYNDMQKNSIYEELTLQQVNDRLLQFRNMELEQPTVAVHLKQINYVKFDWSGVKDLGIDCKNSKAPDLSNTEIRELSDLLVKQTPASLNYGEDAMRMDITRMFNKGVLH